MPIDFELPYSPRLEVLGNRLTDQQRLYVEWLTVLGTPVEAASKAGYSGLPKMSHVMYAYWAELTALLTEGTLISTAVERQLILTQWLRQDPALPIKEAAQVIDLLNKMQGTYAEHTTRDKFPENFEFDILPPKECRFKDE